MVISDYSQYICWLISLEENYAVTKSYHCRLKLKKYFNSKLVAKTFIY